jgi:hypothetical protein
MRVGHIVAIAAIVVVGFGVKVLALSSPRAHANLQPPTNAGMNVRQMHLDYPNVKNIPAQNMHDATFVFSDGD